MQSLIGHQLGNYRLLKLLGRGGFAHVYLGEHTWLGTQVAIKVLSTLVTSASAEAEMFLSEARNIARLEHPHIIRVLDFAISNDTPFLVMEYAPNGSLAEHRPAGVALPRITVLSYIKQVASALQYAHDYKKLIHRDIKPANMLLKQNNEVVLSDFGIAVIAQSSLNLDKQQWPAGTIYYTAPEQLQGNPCLASDQYSLGIVAYEWLSGNRPFQGSFIEISSQHMLILPPSLAGKVPPGVEQVVMQALAKDPKQRFPRVQDFADALESAYLEAQSITHPLHLLPPSHKEAEEKSFNNQRELLPIPINPFEESWASARALASHYQQVIDNYYQVVEIYKQAKNEQLQHFNIEQKTIQDRWLMGTAEVSTIVGQVNQAANFVEHQLKESRWSGLINDVAPLPVSQDGREDIAQQLTLYQSNALYTSTKLHAIINQYRNPVQISYRYLPGILIVLVLALWIAATIDKLPGFLVSLLTIGVLGLTMRLTYMGKIRKQLKSLYVILLQAKEMTEITSQKQDASLRMRYQQARDMSKKLYNEALVNIEQDLDEKVEKLQTILAMCAREANLLVADWNDPQWEQWKPFTVPTPIVRVGSWRVKGPRELPRIPALATCPGLESVLIEFDGASKAVALTAVQSIMLRLLATHPPGGLRFVLIDPIGLGQNVATFMQLADEDERLIGQRAWTESRHIEKELEDLSEHMENVIQKYLRNRYRTIDEYNAVAGEIAEAYRILVVIGFPVNFSAESARRLVSIAASGPRCGVSTLILMDTEQTRPPKFTTTELERSASTIVWNGQNFVWKQKKVEDSQLILDTIPSAKVFHALLRKIGRESQKAHQKVEIPFRRMIEQFLPEDSWWAKERRTHEEINIPLGPSGATRYQYVRLGHGTAHHVLVVGKTGSGKTNFLHVFIIALCLSYHPDELELYLIDFKTVGFTPYATYKLPHARVIAIQSEREFGLSVLDGLAAELETRKRLFSKIGVQNITQYRHDQPEQRMPRIFLLVDEFQEFFSREDAIAHEAAALLDRLVRTGRAFGIHVLLGSQTLAGAFTIARSTISQMAVRIAMQCEEADSRLILSDDNSAARLLSRPGEAIYNADNGAVGGNNTFQCVWLPDEEIQLYLNAIQQLAYQQKYIPPWVQIIFEGDKKADIGENQAFRQVLEKPTWSALSPATTLWLGEPIKIKEPTSVHLHHRSGHNVLIVGPHEEIATGLLTIALLGLATQLSPANVVFYILDFTPIDAPYRIPEQLTAIPHAVKVTKNRRDLAPTIALIIDELEQRSKSTTVTRPAIYLLFYGLQRAYELRIENNISNNRNASSVTLAKDFARILQVGPEFGIHTLAWCDTFSNIHRVLGHDILHEFEIRIALQMSGEDFRQIVDSAEAEIPGLHRAFLFREDTGLKEKFIPYSAPSLEWLQRTIQYICRKH